MRVKYDEDVVCRKSQLQTSEDFGWASDNNGRRGLEVGQISLRDTYWLFHPIIMPVYSRE
jgi:hypothetical protein